MKKILPLLPLLIAVSITYVTQKVIPNTEPKPATTEQIAYEFALSITDYTKQVRSMTDAPLPDALPPQDYLLLTKKDAFSAYKALADNDSKNLIAQCAVGYCYLLGIGTQKDEAAARAYYDRAGDFAPALNTLATMTDDREAAFALYKRAADQHYVTALYNLATAYRLGSGCQKDVQKAEACLQRICDLHLDDANGKGALALAQFHNDVYGERDALPYYVSAAEQGNSSAMFELWFRFFSRYRNQNDSYAAARAHWKRADFTLRAQQKEKRYKSALEKLPFLQQRAESGDAEAMVALANYYSGFESEQRNQRIGSDSSVSCLDGCFLAVMLLGFFGN